MQHLLSRARCDDRAMLDAAADWTVEQLNGEQAGTGGDAILIVDETSDEKSSADCAGAARQYCGATGSIALCQVAVTLTYAVPAGHALIGRALYLPADWAADEERRELAGVPDEVMFATKPELAGELLKQAHDRGISASFVAGDEVYGCLDLRRSIRGLRSGYVMAVRSNHMVTLPSGRRLTVKTARNLVRPSMWQRMRTGSATKGAKDYHWAMIEITPDDTPGGHDDGHAFLLLRRHRYTGTISYYLCWSPRPVPLAKLIEVAVARWKIEEDHQLTKQVTGLDSGQVTTWTSWHRWTAISLLAAAFLAVAAAWQRVRDGSTAALELIPVTVPGRGAAAVTNYNCRYSPWPVMAGRAWGPSLQGRARRRSLAPVRTLAHALVCGRPGRTRVPVTSRPTSVRCWGAPMLRTKGSFGVTMNQHEDFGACRTSNLRI